MIKYFLDKLKLITMVVFHKLAIYSIKLLAKPIVTGVQKRHTKFSNSFDSYSAKFFIWIGK